MRTPHQKRAKPAPRAKPVEVDLANSFSTDATEAMAAPHAMQKRTAKSRKTAGRNNDDGGPAEAIHIRGARVHNLQNIDLDIPHDKLVVITGLSGSGKSSLAFDTIYGEGQRQFVESLSTYARQFVSQLERPDVDLIEGLGPTICIDQRSGSHHPRSTVATVTDIYDYLRLLMARVGKPHCPKCGVLIAQQAPGEILAELHELPEGTKAMVLAPQVRGRKGAHQDVLATVRKAGCVRVRVDGVVYDVENVPELARQKKHDIEAVIDRIVIREGARNRLNESVHRAIREGGGALVVSYLDKTSGDWCDRLFSTEYACATCKLSFDEIEPRTFSFNSPYGACPRCEGLGGVIEFDPELVLPDRALSLAAGAVAPWRGAAGKLSARRRSKLEPLVESLGRDWEAPLEAWKPKEIDALLFGRGKRGTGLIELLEDELASTKSEATRSRLEACRGFVTCSECEGARLRREARAVRIDGRAIHELTALSVEDACRAFEELAVDERDLPVAAPLLAEIRARLGFLDQVGLSYLTLDRAADTLSGGEAQRIRLSAGIGSGLVGVCYVLDEPSIGLHPRDNGRLIDALCDLRDQGNTVLVVEHDEAIMRRADHLIDLGPGAGRHGGHVVAQGTSSAVIEHGASLTGQYLAGDKRIDMPTARRRVSQRRSITLEGAATNNLQDVTVRFPLGALVCVTGVSGSGKSSLMSETLARAVARRLKGTGAKPGPHGGLRGVSQIDRLIEIDQSPPGRGSRSNPATYTGIFDEIRRVFATTREARLRGFKTGRFSFNVKGGRCETCQGQGVQRIEMSFLPDLYVTCPDCRGARFNRQTLAVRYRGRTIAEVLEMTVDEAYGFLENFPAIARMLNSLRDVGLGYITMGQRSTTLSGGESQRVKLATELGRVETGKTLYLLDEPTTGLHFDDIRNLLMVLNRLVDLGNTVVVIEHHVDVIKCADWIIDLGPEGGAAGGQVVACGPPEEIAAAQESHTGRFLAPLLSC